MGIFLTGLVALLALLGYLLDYLLDKKKYKKAYKRIVIIAIILTLAAIGGNYYRQEKEIKRWEAKFESAQEKLDGIKEQNEHLLSQYDSLKAQFTEVSEKLNPFLQTARSVYPALNDDQALTKLATEISKTLGGMQPKIIYLSDKTKSWKDRNTNLIHTIYYFRSQYPVAVRDISITMRFDRTLLRADGRITGAFVVEQGSRMMIDADSRGFTFVTGLLKEDNDIMIEVISNEPLKITSMDRSP
jgi:uncharacterized protein YoxC